MIEIQITCLSARPITISDLNLIMKRGDVVYISVEAAARSAELKILWKARGVTVRRVQRSRERRPAAFSSKAPKKSKGKGAVRPSRPADKKTTDRKTTPPGGRTPPARRRPAQPFDARVMAELRRGLRSDLPKLANDAVDRLLPAIQAIPGPAATAATAATVATVATVADDSMPLFIPEGVVGDVKADITVESGESSTSSVDVASEALKPAKKKKRRKSKKKKEW